MKKAVLILLVAVFLGAITIPAFAAGGKNQHREDGSKGKGKTTQTRVNK